MSNISGNDDIHGFARVAIHDIQYQLHGLQWESLAAANSFKAWIYRCQKTDSVPMFDILYDSFRKDIPKIEDLMIRLRKRNSQKRIDQGIFIKIVGVTTIRQIK